ncbi:hypothetical protein ISS04_04690 [Candidatus Woesearchaeota archaeon]|nr:hypothetical protein [Candidatus Woesearchaeota archaeon]
MKFFIDKIFNGEVDEWVHIQFQKFSRGEFKNRAMIVAKQQASGRFSINTTPEYGNEFVRVMAEKLGEEMTRVTGVVVSTRDLTGELDFQNKKQFMGVKQYILDREMSGNEILELCDKVPNSFMGLSFKVDDSELKIKPKAPKSAKPSSKGDAGPKVDFCRLKTKDLSIVRSLLFDQELGGGWKKIEISHDFNINEIVVSDSLKEEAGGDFALIKEKALRKGRLVRRVRVDEGEEVRKEVEFSA